MTVGGWIVMGLSVGSVTILFLWCMWRVLNDPEEPRHMHGFDTHTPDEESEK